MPSRPSAPPVTAILYVDGAVAARILHRAADALREAGFTCAGLLQHDEPRPDRRRCDMVLVNLSSGRRVRLSEDRGPGARGCHLDQGALLNLMEEARRDLDGGPAILILNKFGRSEAEGGGLRPLLADALERGVPILLGVPWRNVDDWRCFAGDLGTDVHADAIGEATGAPLLDLLGIATSAGGMASSLHSSDEARHAALRA